MTTTQRENKIILQTLREGFPDDGFILIRTKVTEDKQTEVTYVSSLSTADTKKVINGTFLMIGNKDN